jgi:hypothetical protein
MTRVSNVRIEMNREGVRELLTRIETQQMLGDKAHDVASAAQSRGVMVGGDAGQGRIAIPIDVVDATNSSRARMLVTADHPGAIAVEAKYRLLVASLDAAK